MNIDVHKSNLMQSNFYIVREGKHIILVDPFIKSIDCGKSQVDYIFLTHEHYDHISGVNYWKSRFPNAIVFCNDRCARNIVNPKKNGSIHFDAFCKLQTIIKEHSPIIRTEYRCYADETFLNYKILKWENHIIESYHTPGHSEGSSIYLVDNRVLFSGDCIFEYFPTQTKLYLNGRKDFVDISIPLLKSLNKSILVMPGHFETFCLGDAYFFKGDLL